MMYIHHSISSFVNDKFASTVNRRLKKMYAEMFSVIFGLLSMLQVAIGGADEVTTIGTAIPFLAVDLSPHARVFLPWRPSQWRTRPHE